MARADDGSPLFPDDSPTRSAQGGDALPHRGVGDIAPGQVLSGRFRVRRFIARGGMGEVFEAEDLELHEEVALKTIRPEIASHPASLERFKTEVHLARKVTHPSACRIFDVFHHQSQSDGSDVTFLTMELLRGETLAARLVRLGRMTPTEALPLIEQVAGALDAAHRAGVIHRDLKAANVILVPCGPGSSEMRAVVTDFGLARRDPSVDGATAGVSTAGVVVGTPAYMAPEQVEAGTVTPATDIYALGILMYEMLTGKLPFEGDTPWAVMMRRLKSPPTSPRVHVSDLEPTWESVVMRCLDRDPTKRFATTPAMMRALRGEESMPPAARAAGGARRRLLWAAVTGVIVVGIALGAIGWWAWSRPGSASRSSRAAVATTTIRRSVAVLGLRNLSGRPEAAWLAVALAEMLTSEMGAGEAIRTIPGESVARLRAEVPIADFDSLARDTLDRVRARLGSDLLVLGSYTALGDKAGGQIRLDLRLQDTKDGNVVASVSETGTESALFDLVSRTGARLREKLGISVPTDVERESVRASLPQDPVAAQLYADGLTRLRTFDTPAARDLLERAKAKDPAHALTRAALARTWTLLGYDRRAEEEAKAAMGLAASLSREDRLSIEGQYEEAARRWDKAIEIYRTLFNFFPDNLEYGLRLASAQESGGKGKEAFDTLDALRKLPAPVGTDPRIDLAEAVTARYQSESQRGVEAAGRAAKAATASGATYLLARARFEEGSNLQNLGKMDEAVTALSEAEGLFRKAGDRRGVASALNNRGLVSIGRGDVGETEKLWGEALAIYREIGSRSGEALMISNLGNVDYIRGDRTGARRRWEQTLPIYRELNEPEGEGLVLINVASVLGEQGDNAGARAMFQEALALYQKTGHKSRELSATGNIASCWYQEGDLQKAERGYQQVMVLFKDTGDKEAAAPFLQQYGDLLRDKADVAGARKAYTDALTLHQQMKQEGEAAEARLAILILDVDEGKAGEAEPSARQVLDTFVRLKASNAEAGARSLLARIAAAQGRAIDAKKEARQAQALAAKSEGRVVRLRLEVACARVLGALDAPERKRALDLLQKAQVEATRISNVPLMLEARLVLGEIEIRTSPAGAKQRLRDLQNEAAAKGFARIAALAASAAQ